MLNERESAVAEVMDHVTENEGDQNGNTLRDVPTTDMYVSHLRAVTSYGTMLRFSKKYT